MKVKMLVDAPGSPDGIQVVQYEAGESYDVPDDLGSVLVAEGLAAEAASKPAPKAAAKKTAPAENK